MVRTFLKGYIGFSGERSGASLTLFFWPNIGCPGNFILYGAYMRTVQLQPLLRYKHCIRISSSSRYHFVCSAGTAIQSAKSLEVAPTDAWNILFPLNPNNRTSAIQTPAQALTCAFSLPHGGQQGMQTNQCSNGGSSRTRRSCSDLSSLRPFGLDARGRDKFDVQMCIFRIR